MKKEQEGQASKKIRKRYIDANLFIYATIDNESIGKRAKNILRKIKEGEYMAYTSTLTVDEFLWRVQKEIGKELAEQTVSIFFDLPNLELINIDKQIITSAIEIYKNEKLDPRDSIHLAAMKSKNIKAIISTDPDFDKIQNIKRVDFAKEKEANSK